MRTVTLIIGLCIALSVASVAQQPTTLRITDGPRVESVSSNSAQIAWTTNAAAGSMLLYGTDQNGIQRSSDRGWPANQIQPSGTTPGMAEIPWGGTTHRIQLTNLQPQTTYYFAVRSTAGENTAGMTTSNVSSFTTRGNGQAQYGGYQNQGGNSSAYRQGMADGRRDRNGNQARNYRGQYDNANDRAAYQYGYDQSYGNRNGNGNGRPYDSRDQYGRDQNGNPNRDETGVRRDDEYNDNGSNQGRGNNGGYYDPGNGTGPNGQYGGREQNPAYQNGFQDGIRDGRNDFQYRRNSSPMSTANYRNATGGYDRSWGSQSQYKDMYRQGYTRGYQQGYNGQGSYEPR
jgi:purple acid phosphatase-like protein